METIPTIFSDPKVLDTLDMILADDDPEYSKAMSRIPGLFGSSEKATFLMYRSIGLTEKQIVDRGLIGGLRPSTIEFWRQKDEHFKQFELTKLGELQKSAGPDMVRLGFLRNLTMLVAGDSRLIDKAQTDLEELSDREFEMYSRLRKQYNANELLALEKAINPDKHPEGVIQLTWVTPGQIYELPEPQDQIEDADYREVEE